MKLPKIVIFDDDYSRVELQAEAMLVGLHEKFPTIEAKPKLMVCCKQGIHDRKERQAKFARYEDHLENWTVPYDWEEAEVALSEFLLEDEDWTNGVIVLLDQNFDDASVQKGHDLVNPNSPQSMFWAKVLKSCKNSVITFASAGHPEAAYKLLKQSAIQGRSTVLRGAVPTDSDQLKGLVRYAWDAWERIQGVEPILWPRDSNWWFHDDDSVPHDHENFWPKGSDALNDGKELLTGPIGRYVSDLIKYRPRKGEEFDEKIVLKLLSKPWFYEAMKYFVGASSMLGTGNPEKETPRSWAFIFPLMLATGTSKWLDPENISVKDPMNKFAIGGVKTPDVDGTRHLFLSAYRLFEKIGVHDNGADLIQSVTIRTDNHFDVFSLVLTFPAARRKVVDGREGKGGKPSILDRTQAFSGEKVSGRATKAYVEFQKACSEGAGDRAVYSWFLPHSDPNLTEFRIVIFDRK